MREPGVPETDGGRGQGVREVPVCRGSAGGAPIWRGETREDGRSDFGSRAVAGSGGPVRPGARVPFAFPRRSRRFAVCERNVYCYWYTAYS
jgi:hypothetical protein